MEMRSSFLLGLGQLVCCVAAVILGCWIQVPWLGLLGLALVGISVIAASLIKEESRDMARWPLVLGAFATLLVLAAPFVATSRPFTLDCYQAVIFWLVALAALPRWLAGQATKRNTTWKLLIFGWALLGCALWLGAAYAWNLRGLFYIGLLTLLALLIGCKKVFTLPTWAVLTLNTLLLLFIFAPAVDVLTRPKYRLGLGLEEASRYYSYEGAKKDPSAFRHWWNQYYTREWVSLSGELFMPDRTGILPFRLKPNGEGHFFKSRIRINRLGFRGAEIADKGREYRMVALGESSTFGVTLNAEDKPWPEILEGMIKQRLGPSRPVRVVNAGVPAYNIRHNLTRLESEILPLKPDMIISYHGFNGFGLLDDSVPGATGPPSPAYTERPLRLLADAEHALRIYCYNHREASTTRRTPVFSNPMASHCANAYRELIDFAQTNQIQLVLCDFAMAVNERSARDEVEFYRSTFPSLHWQIRANSVHSELLRALTRENPATSFVDCRRGLDGEPGLFIDLMHPNQAGNEKLAENIFEAIRPRLEAELKR
jgi:lysophospholipase L1-like esterase